MHMISLGLVYLQYHLLWIQLRHLLILFVIASLAMGNRAIAPVTASLKEMGKSYV